MSWYFHRENKLFLKLFVQPGAKQNEIVGLLGDELKIKLKSRAIEGQANDALLKYLAQQLDFPRTQMTLKSGKTSRHKIIEIEKSSLNLAKLSKLID